MNHLLANYMKRFFSHYLPVQKGLSVNTIHAYRDAIKLLLCYAADTLGRSVDRLAVQDITEKVVIAYLDYVEQQRNCSPRTRNARLAAIRSLFAFIAREEPALLQQCQRIRAIPLKRTQHQTVDYLEEKEMQAILDAVDSNSRTGIRDKALLLLLYNTGARVSEIVEIKLHDLRLDGAGQVHLLGKGKNIAVALYGRKRLLLFKLTWSNAPRKSQESSTCFLTPMALPSLASESAISPANTGLPPRISALPLKQKLLTRTLSGTLRPCTCCGQEMM